MLTMRPFLCPQERATPDRAARTSPYPENSRAMPATGIPPSPAHVIEEVSFGFPWIEAARRTASAPKREAPAGPFLSRKAAFTSPYNEFCKEQRSLLLERPLPHQHKDREKLLGGLS